MRDRIASEDWSRTPLGSPAQWATSLRTVVGIILGSRFPMLLWWGADLVHVYNDGYAPILGDKHPGALGRPASKVWAEIWHVVGPMAEGVLAGEPATWSEDLLLLMNRHGLVEEAYFTFSYSPAPNDEGGVGGVLVTVQETTSRVFGERQLRLLGQLTERCGQARSVTAVCHEAAGVFQDFTQDVPFAVVLLPDERAGQPRLVASHGLPDEAAHKLVASLDSEAIHRVEGAGAGIEISVEQALAGIHVGPWTDAAKRASVIALRRSAREAPYGYLVAGHSAKRLFDAGYQSLFQAAADRIAAALANAAAYQEEQARHAALAALDRAKTAFFTNISHEFRTPLTLMLGPIEEALKTESLNGEELDLVYRNGRRLLRLVNGLLDFARIEAGRMQAQFVATDLPELTRDLVSIFRSAAERAGLTLQVQIPPLSEPVQVDVEMYEKIVSNLLSNAIKFTREGSISISLSDRGDNVELEVADTGVGIAQTELPRLFERFHRIEDTWSRTQEGSGIGLALLKDLVALHRGSVAARSAQGHGTTITVALPKSIRPVIGVAQPLVARSTSGHSAALADEALGWSGTEQQSPPPLQSTLGEFEVAPGSAAKILIADDNADMREYLSRILGSRWKVQVVSDGAEALQAIATTLPDLVISDVMMPRIDGFALLAALRKQPDTRLLPFMLVSARAGEEARIEAVRAGVDDYVVKPFSARELVARAEAQLLRGKLRAVEIEQSRRLAEVFEQAPVGVALLRGPEHRFEFANADYVKLAGGRDLVGLPIRTAFADLEDQGIYELLDQVYASEQPFVGRSVRLMVDDSEGVSQERFFDFVYQPISGEQGQVNGIAVVVYDVSALTAARREADAANRAKDDFLAMLGHELRNPLAPIVTTLHLMRLKGDHVLQRERSIVERQVDHLVRLVDDLLDVSRIASGKVALKRASIDLREVLGMALETAGPALEQHRHRLTYEVSKEPLPVSGDAARLAQVISNLLVNAAKYTPPSGEIKLSADRGDASVVISVVDNGIGIAPETLPRIFDLFAQERQAVDRAKGGLGLGLTIVKTFVELHGGKVTAHSAGQGKGSEFRVVLPLLDEPEAAEVPAPSTNLPFAVNRRVLIVDDNIDAGEALAAALEMHGVETVAVTDGPQALLAARSFEPEIAVLDIGLPVMDGYALAAALREQQPEVRLIAVTGYGADIDRQRSSDAAFEMHLVKPVDIAVLLNHLRG